METPKLSNRQIERALKSAFKQANRTPEQIARSERMKKAAAKREAARELTPKEKKRLENIAKARQNLPVKVRLSLQHFVNGRAYGPGDVEVPQHLANEFLYREQQHRAQEESFYGTKSVIVGPRVGHGTNAFHRTTLVPNETFDDSWTNPNPSMIAGSISGKNMSDSGQGNKF